MKSRSKTLRLSFLFIAALSVSGAFSSCKTVQGFGRDVEKLGSKIEEKADKHTRY